MRFEVVTSPDSVGWALAIAELDRVAWAASPGASFVPDGEHAWRVWAEYSFVAAAISDGLVLGALGAFDTSTPTLHFLHKLFVRADVRGTGIGRTLMDSYCAYLDGWGMLAELTTAPTNEAMIALSDSFGFTTTREVPGPVRL